MLELIVDPSDDRILDVATAVSLPGHTALLQRLLVGRRVRETDAAARALSSCYRGPLLKPTIAALANATSNCWNGLQDEP